MAKIIAFKLRASPQEVDRVLDPAGARILFFTGVRYERLGEGQAAPVKRRRSPARKSARQRTA